MANSDAFDDFHSALRRLAEELYDWIDLERGDDAWEKASFDVRYAPDGSYWSTKIRIDAADGTVKSLVENDEISLILGELSEIKTGFDPQWYSLRVDVDRNRHVKTSLGYDPKAIEDPSFFAD